LEKISLGLNAMKWIAVAFITILLLFGNDTAFARGGGGGGHGGGGRSSSHSSSGTHSGVGRGGPVHVHGYYRKDGKYVPSHTRHLPGTAPKVVTHQAHLYQTHIASGYIGARDSTGRIIRSEAAKDEFMRMTGFPHGRPGYVVDHIIALKRGGPDTPSNMQWQTIAEAKAKDRWE
jgi:hypothetical protein